MGVLEIASGATQFWGILYNGSLKTSLAAVQAWSVKIVPLAWKPEGDRFEKRPPMMVSNMVAPVRFRQPYLPMAAK